MEKRLRRRPLPVLNLSDCLSPEHLQLQNNDNPFIRSMQTSLVAEHLSEYLFFEDLKALTMVSRDCLNAIRNTKAFSTRARFTIRKPRSNVFRGPDKDGQEVDMMASLHVLQGSSYQWKNFSIQLGTPGLLSDNQISEIEDCLRSTKSVVFHSYYECDDAKVLAEWLQFEPVLQRMRKLRELEIYAPGCLKLRERLFLSSGDVLQEIFSIVDSLKINAEAYCNKFQSHNQHKLWLNFEWNFQPCRYSQLKKFCVMLPIRYMGDNKLRTHLCSGIVKIIDLKADTLEELQLHLDLFRFEETKTIRLPKLKRLLLEIDDLTSLEGVETFLQNQVPLEELRIRIRMEAFPLGPLLKHLEDADKLGKMQRLCIVTRYGLPSDSWTSLKGMRNLKVVHFADLEFLYTRGRLYPVDWLQQSYPQILFNKCIGSSCYDFGCDVEVKFPK